jgi:hypothetical protein
MDAYGYMHSIHNSMNMNACIGALAGRKSVVMKDFLDGLAQSVREVESLPPTIVNPLASQFLSFSFLGEPISGNIIKTTT